MRRHTEIVKELTKGARASNLLPTVSTTLRQPPPTRSLLAAWWLAALFLLILLAASACAGGRSRLQRTVVLVTDAGCEVDDQWALAHLLLLNEAGRIDLAGVVTTHAPSLAPPAAQSSAAAAREIVDLVAPREPPPVIAGSSEPLSEPGKPRESRGADFIAALSRNFTSERRLTVLSIGAATEIASALLLDPSAAERIEIVAMGFEGWPQGGDPWNVKNDPLAFRTLLAADVPLAIGDAEVTKRHLTVDEESARRLIGSGGTARERLREILRGWLDREGDLCRKVTGRRAWPIWDLVVVAHLLGLTQDESRPRPRLRDDLTFDIENPQGLVRWITVIDERKLWRDLHAGLSRASNRR